jgi:serine/threonine-protein kinase
VALAPGSRLGPYEILSAIGAGGMGEVWRARDTQLKRDVAIKVLPDDFAKDPERLGRFQREAELLATLNHPNIAAVYGVERSSGVNAIVLELVEGETLADRLQRGAIPADEAVTIARQIAEAMESAHEKGIVHRDLKPANVKVTPDDRVKVLDFGLARAMTDEPALAGAPVSANATHSPTLGMLATQTGVILGTAAYMSPEQAKGLPADHRSDVFSFGCVLYEMLIGRQPFQGETAADLLASVVARDPDFAALPSNLNPRLIELLKRCLAKQAKRRWQAVGDLRIELETIASAPITTVAAATTGRASRSWLGIAAALVAVGAAGLLTGALASISFRSAGSPQVVRLSLPLPEGQRFAGGATRRRILISPDGRQIAYVTNDQLFVRAISGSDAKLLTGTGSRQAIQGIAFSPDSQQIAYFSFNERALKRIPIGGGPAITVASGFGPVGLSWGERGILFGSAGAIMRVNPDGGAPEPLVPLEATEVAVQPEMLPGDRAVMFTVLDGASASASEGRLVVQVLGSNARKTLAEVGTDGHFLSSGHVAYLVGGALFARLFDLKRLEASGSAVPIVEGVERSTGAVGYGLGQYSISDTGTLLYAPGPALVAAGQRRVVMLDRNGKATPLDVPAGAFQSPRLSPDGKRLALVSDDGKQAHVHVYELGGGTSLKQLTFEGRNRFAVWTPDSQWIVFQSTREGDNGVWRIRADGSGVPERLTRAEKGTAHIPESFLGHTDTFSYSVVESAERVTLRTFSIGTRQSKTFGDLQSRAPLNSEFSPDGRWVAYTLRVGGAQVYVQPVPPTGAKHIISSNAHHPEWSPDGSRLLYFPGAEPIVSVPISTRDGFAVGNPTPVPGGPVSNMSTGGSRNNDISPDGSQIVAVLQGATGPAPGAQALEVVLNWTEELKQRVPVK